MNTIDNQPVIYQNPWNNRQKTGKTRNDKQTKYENKTTEPNPEILKSYKSCSRQKSTGKCLHTGKVNAIDNQPVIYQNPWNNRQKTGKTRNDKQTKYESKTTEPNPEILKSYKSCSR